MAVKSHFSNMPSQGIHTAIICRDMQACWIGLNQLASNAGIYFLQLSQLLWNELNKYLLGKRGICCNKKRALSLVQLRINLMWETGLSYNAAFKGSVCKIQWHLMVKKAYCKQC